jgi:hypothetical protein
MAAKKGWEVVSPNALRYPVKHLPIMSFSTNDIVEIETSQYRAVARVRNVDGDRLHVALDPGGYLPWVDDPVLVRPAADPSIVIDARILHAGGVTALIELIDIADAAGSTDRLPAVDV